MRKKPAVCVSPAADLSRCTAPFTLQQLVTQNQTTRRTWMDFFSKMYRKGSWPYTSNMVVKNQKQAKDLLEKIYLRKKENYITHHQYMKLSQKNKKWIIWGSAKVKVINL